MMATDTTSEIRMAATSVIENSRNSRSTSPPMNRIDTNTTDSASVIATSVKPTSRTPRRAAWRGPSPRSRWREMFSSTTMASSTTRPAATISAISDRLLSEKPHRYMTAKVATRQTGIATLGMAAARALPRNSHTTRITSPTASPSVTWASRSVAWMPGERSSTTVRSTSAGISARRPGRAWLMAAMVSMMLAPGWRLMVSTTAGSWL
ncbi:Uncharacterised protein [Achromobacter xylosoxidans]|nr:Uncharacterised protein [Achromobacter xylosoxidans]